MREKKNQAIMVVEKGRKEGRREQQAGGRGNENGNEKKVKRNEDM